MCVLRERRREECGHGEGGEGGGGGGGVWGGDLPGYVMILRLLISGGKMEKVVCLSCFRSFFVAFEWCSVRKVLIVCTFSKYLAVVDFLTAPLSLPPRSLPLFRSLAVSLSLAEKLYTRLRTY